jgi:H+-transporting ATPase
MVESLCSLDEHTKTEFRADVERAAAQGYRSLALAKQDGTGERRMRLLGLLLLSDTLRPHAAHVIHFLKQHAIAVKMITGDNRAIAARVATALGLRGNTLPATGRTEHLTKDQLDATDVFAEVSPDDKFRIVQASATSYVVAATGDGVNDLPALRRASVGIAVKNAVDALKSAADIVLMTNGIGVIENASLEARRIFVRTYYYSVYRISESFRLILSIAILSIIYGAFPLTPVQIILLALLNDLPIITLAYDHVEPSSKPAAIHVRERVRLASLYGCIGILESLGLFFLMRYSLRLSMPVIQTMFFLKLAVSGHMLIYVAHTKRHWWQWLPSKQVIWATSLTQLAASVISLWGVLFQGIALWQVLLVWGWELVWMQFETGAKQVFQSRLSL